MELSNTNNTLSEKYLFFIHLNRVVINKYYFEFLPLFRGIQLYKPTSSPVKSQIANDLTWPWSDQRVFSFSNLEGHHFDNREAPWDEAGMKKESTERTEKSNKANHTQYSCENFFIVFPIQYFSGTAWLFRLIQRMTDYWKKNSLVHSVLLFQNSFKSTKRTVNNHVIIVKGRLPKGSCEPYVWTSNYTQ